MAGTANRNSRAKHLREKRWRDTEHWKYPETVGHDTGVDELSFNSHESSEYAIKRLAKIATMAHEPFIMFEFMKIDEDKSVETQVKQRKAIAKLSDFTFKSNPASYNTEEQEKNQDVLTALYNQVADPIKAFVKDIVKQAERKYTGSIALYMPTDIQINDSMTYNEDTRKLGALIEGWADSDNEIVNMTVGTDPAVLALAGAAYGLIPKLPGGKLVSAVVGGTVGAVVSKEVQRATGKIMNPNELLRYQQTALRSFAFNWQILPDSENESKQAAGLIKFFRKSAHANRTSSTLVTVPDHVVTSFHGGGTAEVGMIQLPPCYIESVNVSYNPNNSSFFKQNNAPVEISLAVTLKEIIPIYSEDVTRGY